MAETTFTRCDVDVDPYEVKLRVSRDQDEITWKSARHNFNIVEKLSLADFQRVSMGQIGPGFDNAKPFALLACCLGPGITERTFFSVNCLVRDIAYRSVMIDEASSFALVFRQESLDLIAQSPTSMREWVDAFQELVARFESAATTTIRETKASGLRAFSWFHPSHLQKFLAEAAHQKQEAREELRGRYRGKAEVFKTKYGAINK